MNTANASIATIASIAISRDGLDFWKESLEAHIEDLVQEGRIGRVRAVLTVLNRRKSSLQFGNAEEVQRVKESLEAHMRWIGGVYVQYYLRNAWAATAKGLVAKVLNRKKGTNMEVHSTDEFDALIADLDARIEKGTNRIANATQRDRLLEARELFAPYEQPFAELDGALQIAQAVESPEAARELLANSPANDESAKADAKADESAKQPTGVQRAPEGSENPWRVYAEDGSFTEHTSRSAAREANRASKQEPVA